MNPRPAAANAATAPPTRILAAPLVSPVAGAAADAVDDANDEVATEELETVLVTGPVLAALPVAVVLLVTAVLVSLAADFCSSRSCRKESKLTPTAEHIPRAYCSVCSCSVASHAFLMQGAISAWNERASQKQMTYKLERVRRVLRPRLHIPWK
jgi:hypothetical protein